MSEVGNHETSLQPDFEVLVRRDNEQYAVAGIFLTDGDEMDIGLGLVAGASRYIVAHVLALAGKAFTDASNWYDQDSMEANPLAASKIKHGDWQ